MDLAETSVEGKYFCLHGVVGYDALAVTAIVDGVVAEANDEAGDGAASVGA